MLAITFSVIKYFYHFHYYLTTFFISLWVEIQPFNQDDEIGKEKLLAARVRMEENDDDHHHNHHKQHRHDDVDYGDYDDDLIAVVMTSTMLEAELDSTTQNYIFYSICLTPCFEIGYLKLN